MEGNITDILGGSPASENILIIAKASDLQDFAREYAAIILKQEREKREKEKPVNSKPLTSKDACLFLQITMPTLIKYRKKGLLTGHVFDGKV